VVRVGNGEVLDRGIGQVGQGVDRQGALRQRPEHDPADGVVGFRLREDEPLGLQLIDIVDARRGEDIDRCPRFDLLAQLSGRAEGELDIDTSLLGEEFPDLLKRRRQIGSGGHCEGDPCPLCSDRDGSQAHNEYRHQGRDAEQTESGTSIDHSLPPHKSLLSG